MDFRGRRGKSGFSENSGDSQSAMSRDFPPFTRSAITI